MDRLARARPGTGSSGDPARTLAMNESARPPARGFRPSAETVGLGQGMYWLVTGVWPFLSRRAFERVTGPKRDWWLVLTVGGLVAAVGGTLALAAARRRVTPEVRLLGLSGAAFLAAIDTFYVARGRISPVYLADAAVEVGIAAAWARARA